MATYEEIQKRVNQWREARYPCADYPAVAKILDHLTISGANDAEPHLRFVRALQLQALETFWYLRLVEGTIVSC